MSDHKPVIRYHIVCDDGGTFDGAPDGEWVKASDYDALQAELAALKERLQIAVGALADIAYSKDMTLELAQKKSARIYEGVRDRD